MLDNHPSADVCHVAVMSTAVASCSRLLLVILLLIWPFTAESQVLARSGDSARMGSKIAGVHHRSTDSLKLVRGDNLYILHNYTVLQNDETIAAKYQSQELVQHYRHVIRSETTYFHHVLAKRGFVANPATGADGTWPADAEYRYITWAWLRASNDCPLRIQFCFEDESTKNELWKMTMDAFALWHNALGDRRGIHLELTKGDPSSGVADAVCRDKSGRWSRRVTRNAVMISNGHDGVQAYSGTIGYMPGKIPGRMELRFDPSGDDYLPDPYKAAVASLAHELGTSKRLLANDLALTGSRTCYGMHRQ